MKNIKHDIEYINLINDILINDEFNEIKNTTHHGISRFEHSYKVSYYAYKVAKSLKLNYKDVARAGLLHDFYISDEERDYNERSKKDKFLSTFTHPKKALYNSTMIFDVNEHEKNIIIGHMFPFYIAVPKSLESWIVNITDKVIGGAEFCKQYRLKLSYFTNFYLIFLLNFVR